MKQKKERGRERERRDRGRKKRKPRYTDYIEHVCLGILFHDAHAAFRIQVLFKFSDFSSPSLFKFLSRYVSHYFSKNLPLLTS